MIKCQNLKKSYGDVEAVKDISFTMEDHKFVGFLGPNGAGKTTLIKMLIGLLLPDDGSVTFDGLDMNRDAMSLKKRIGVVSQHVTLDKELTVYENMIFAGKLYGLKKKEILEKTEELLTLLDLIQVKDRVSKKLSGGMKRKLMIAIALIHNPDYLFLDEPTVGIDVNARKDIWRFLKHFHKQGKTIILTTHYIEEAEKLCDYVLLIHEGKVFREDTADDLIDELGAYKVVLDDLEETHMFFNTFDQAQERAGELEGLYKIEKTTLEDVFYLYTKGKIEWK